MIMRLYLEDSSPSFLGCLLFVLILVVVVAAFAGCCCRCLLSAAATTIAATATFLPLTNLQRHSSHDGCSELGNPDMSVRLQRFRFSQCVKFKHCSNTTPTDHHVLKSALPSAQDRNDRRQQHGEDPKQRIFQPY